MENKKITLGTLVILILFLGGFWALNHFLFGVPGAVFSCDNDSFVKFGSTSMPPANIACPYNCIANMTIFDETGLEICSNSNRGCSSNNVLVPCKDLENYEVEYVKIKYSINDGETKTTEVQYNK